MGRLILSLFAVGWISHGFAATVLDRIVAVVNDEVVLESELDYRVRAIEDQLAAKGTPLPPDYVLEQQVLERLIIERLQLQLAARTGIRVGDEALNQTLERIAANNGLTLSEFHDALERDGYDFPSFRENIRNELIISQLQKREIADHVKASEAEIDNFLTTQKNQGNPRVECHLAHILITVPRAATPEQVQTAKAKAKALLNRVQGKVDFQKAALAYSDGQQALEGGDLGWRKLSQLPTLFVDVVPKLHVGEVSGLLRSPSGFHIVKLLDRRGGGQQQQVVTQTHARHILIRTDDLTSDQDAKQQLSQLRQQIMQGDQFTELARSHSDDKLSALKGGDLGWISPGQMIPLFEEVMNSLEPGEISQPFESHFGWHIVQVLERRQQNMTEEFKRNKARMAIRQRKIEQERESWLRQLRAEAYIDYRLSS